MSESIFRVDTPSVFPLSFPTMLVISLPRLERERTLEIRGELPPDYPGWEGTDLRFSTPLSVLGQARWISSGEVVVHLFLRGALDQECRRCLAPVAGELEIEVDFLFAPRGEGDDEDDEVRPLPEAERELDLTDPIREEVVLSEPRFPLCRPDCRGLCPRCGANLNDEQCQCSVEDSDPRWDTLRALREERD